MVGKRRRLGQHFLNSGTVARRIVAGAEITKEDIVFEMGTGLGALTPLLCKEAKEVISVDADDGLIRDARSRFSDIGNLVLVSGDGLKSGRRFTVFVSSLPYSRSRDAVEWLARTRFSHGVIVVQKEFAEKIATRDPRRRRAISVIAGHCFEISVLEGIGRDSFAPPPKVDSVALSIRQKAVLDGKTIRAINGIFSYRRKTVRNIQRRFGVAEAYGGDGIPHGDARADRHLDDLSGDEIVGLAEEIGVRR